MTVVCAPSLLTQLLRSRPESKVSASRCPFNRSQHTESVIGLIPLSRTFAAPSVQQYHVQMLRIQMLRNSLWPWVEPSILSARDQIPCVCCARIGSHSHETRHCLIDSWPQTPFAPRTSPNPNQWVHPESLLYLG